MFPLRLLLRQSPLNLPIVLPLSIKERFHFPLNSTANSRYVLTYGHVATLSLPISEAMGNGPGGGRKAGGGRSWGIPSPSCLGPRNHWYLLTCQEHLLLAPPQRHLLPGPPNSIPSLHPGGGQGSSLTWLWCLNVPLSPPRPDCTHIIINSLFTKASSITQLKGTFPFLLEPYLIQEVLNKDG